MHFSTNYCRSPPLFTPAVGCAFEYVRHRSFAAQWPKRNDGADGHEQGHKVVRTWRLNSADVDIEVRKRGPLSMGSRQVVLWPCPSWPKRTI